jgi:hypothetical protein
MSRILNLQRSAVEELLDSTKQREVHPLTGVTPKTMLMIQGQHVHHLGVSLPILASFNRTKVLLVGNKPNNIPVDPKDYEGPMVMMLLREATPNEIAQNKFQCASETVELLNPCDIEQGIVTLAFTGHTRSYPRLVGG